MKSKTEKNISPMHILKVNILLALFFFVLFQF